VASQIWVTIKTKQSLKPRDVDLSGDCLVALIGSIFGPTFDQFDNGF
jgi:hypothetical protein